jgi:hypothetical protein
LILVVIFLLIISVIKDRLWNLIFPKKINQPFSTVKIESIKEIELTNENKTINLYKKNGSWLLKKDSTEYKADEERINKITAALISLVKDEVVSKNKGRHRELGIINNKIVFKGDKQYRLYIGNVAGIDKNYLRINNETDVFAGSGLSDIFSPFDYRDLNINFIGDEADVHLFEISYNGNSVSMEKKKNKWFLTGGRQAKKDRVDFFLNDLKTLKANDILPKDTAFPYYPELTIKVKINNKVSTAEFFPVADGKESYYLKTSTADFIFQLPAVYVSSLKKEGEDFSE